MAITPLAQRPPDGDYVITRGSDTPEQRADAEQTLRANGCQRFWHDTLPDGRLQAHGYVRAA
jgi:hypothetical protein